MNGITPTYQYRIDADDRLVWVDEWWLAFACENGAPHLDAASVLNRPLWDFVSGDGTRRLFEEIHARVRENGQSVTVPFHCDSPSLQRHMRLKVSSAGENALSYESALFRAKPQRYMSLLDERVERSDSLLTMCSCCKRALLESVGWLELEDVVIRLRVFDIPEVPDLHQLSS